MIVYRDMTFCTAKCANTKCHRPLNEYVMEGAKEADMLIAAADFSKTCKDYVEDVVK
jgi:hypothetical protein